MPVIFATEETETLRLLELWNSEPIVCQADQVSNCLAPRLRVLKIRCIAHLRGQSYAGWKAVSQIFFAYQHWIGPVRGLCIWSLGDIRGPILVPSKKIKLR